MESEIEITGPDAKGWFEKIKDWSYGNWQTILVVLIVLIVGVSAYNYNQQKDNSSPAAIISDNESDENNQDNEIENKNTEENNQEAIVENKDQEEAFQEDNKTASGENEKITNENTKKENLEEVFSSSDDSGKTYTATASRGEGITHLARKALEEYIQETENGSNLTKEQKIYAEDYIQNKTGSGQISIGHQETFSENLIKTAISNANNLSEKSLENLTKYIK